MSIVSPLVFIIEDDLVYRKYLSKVLSEKGIKTKAFSDGEEGINHLNQKPDLILLDFSLKGLNGLDTLKAINENQKNTRTFVLTGLDDPKVAQLCLDNGAEAYLQKDEESIKKIIATVQEIKSRKNKSKLFLWGLIILIIVALIFTFI